MYYNRINIQNNAKREDMDILVYILSIITKIVSLKIMKKMIYWKVLKPHINSSSPSSIEDCRSFNVDLSVTPQAQK